MSGVKYIVGAPVWDRAWSLPLWFAAVEANVPKAETGLLFVVPPMDQATRDMITERGKGFAFCDILRDKHKPFDREHRGEQKHATLASARNQLLVEVNKVRPEIYISWDSDMLVSPGVVGKIVARQLPICTVWAWLNRQKPQRLRHLGDDKELRTVLWQEPMQGTAMEWNKRKTRACHLPGADWDRYASGFWQAEVVLGFQVMRPPIYMTTAYGKHPDGEDIPFNRSLEQRGVERWVYGEEPGVHLYRLVRDELALGYPGIMDLAQQRPIASTHTPRTEKDAILGFYPVEQERRQEKIGS